jgi:predicted DNA-binding helix-hairpin-helix protein
VRIDESHADRRAPKFSPAGQGTQMIVGADGANDAQIVATSASLYASYDLKRIYYSAFSPIPDSSRLLPVKPAPLVREHRLYQADWLYRFYGFSAEEIASSMDGGMLDLAIDPKLAWALRNRARFPINVNTAAREELLRIPGLGRKTIDRIIVARRHRTLRLDDLARLCGAIAARGRSSSRPTGARSPSTHRKPARDAGAATRATAVIRMSCMSRHFLDEKMVRGRSPRRRVRGFSRCGALPDWRGGRAA